MAFDYKKAFRELYMPGRKPEIVAVPPMNYAAVRGRGDPNAPDGDYKRSIEALYAAIYTIKMSKLGDHRIDGYFDFVAPPLEGFWWQPGVEGIDYGRKADFHWISCVRLPDFATPETLRWAAEEAGRRKGADCGAVEFLPMAEGLCAQLLHVGPYDDEPASLETLGAFVAEQGYESDFSDARRHHEIYLSDARRVAPERLRTVIRHPIRRRGGA